MIKFEMGLAQDSGELPVYVFDLESGEFIGVQNVFVHKGFGLSPGQTPDAPPQVRSGWVARRIGDAWEKVKDQRGIVYSTFDGRALHYGQLGALPDDLTPIPQPSPDYGWTQGQWVLDAARQIQRRQVLADELTRKVDGIADLVRDFTCGGPTRMAEYALAISDALEFQSSGYPDDAIPRSVAAGVSPSKTARQAAEEVIAASTHSEEAVYRIRELRLTAKAEIRQLLADGKEAAALAVAGAAEVALMELKA